MAEMVTESRVQRKPILAPFDNFLYEVLKKLAFGTTGKHTIGFFDVNVGENPLPNSANRCLRNGRETKLRLSLQVGKAQRNKL